jgi:peptidoglycan/LPS O-acetylase OafA/YrhL
MTWATIQISIFVTGFGLAVLLAQVCHQFMNADVTEQRRYAHLDGLRAVAALAVVVCHINQYLLSFFGFQQIPDVGNRFGALGVQIFFALTAFLFTSKALEGKLRPETFYVGRLKRIAPLYLVVATVAIVSQLHLMPGRWFLTSAGLNEVLNVYAFQFFNFKTLTLGGQNMLPLVGIAWTLSYEWAFYLLLVPAYYVARSSRPALVAFVAVAVIVAARDFWFDGDVVWPFFIVGSAAAVAYRQLPEATGKIRVVLLLSIAPLIALSVGATGGYGFTLENLVLAGALFFAVLFGRPRILQTEPMQILGRISYSIYLLQYLVLHYVVKSVTAYGITDASPVWKFAAALLIIAILIPLSCLSYLFIEKRWMGTQTRILAPGPVRI